jgi:hypothetical protein
MQKRSPAFFLTSDTPDQVPHNSSGTPAERGAQRPPAGVPDGSLGPRPSNTGPNNSIGREPPYFHALRWGVDSLYLSYKGKITLEAEIKLKKLKELAQSKVPGEVALAQIKLGNHIFEVKDRGAGQFPYILEDGTFRICIPKSTTKALPAAYVKISSFALTARDPEDLEAELSVLLMELTHELELPKVSRIDLFIDFASSVDMESWGREAWVTRAGSINAYSVANQFSGWSVGLGGPIACRLYDKTLEIFVQSKKEYLFPLWREQGWDGAAKVWRLEFELKQEILSQLARKDFIDVMDSLGGIWGYATTEWLRLTLPNPEDKTRSRWPIHPLWAALASIDWNEDGGELTREFKPSRAPGHDWLMNYGLSAVTSFMAVRSFYEFEEGLTAFCSALMDYHDQKAFHQGLSLATFVREKVALKVRQYNTGLNADELTDEQKRKAGLEAAKDAYRKASDGE